MKFKKPTQKTAVDTVVKGLSLGTGVVLSKGAMSLLPAEYQTTMYKGGVALLSFLVSMIIKGETTLDKSVQAAFMGMGLQQGVEALSSVIGDQINVDPNATGGQKFLQASLGLGNGASAPNIQLLPKEAWQGSAPIRQQAPTTSEVDFSA